MKSLWFFIFFYCIAKSSAENLQKPSTLKSIPTVDALILRLEVEKWADDEACRQTSLRILHGVRNNTLWATWIWDSMQSPLGAFYGAGMSYGNYDQCLNIPWSSEHVVRTQYCLVEVTIQEPKKHRAYGPYDRADEYLNTKSKFGRILNKLGVGACMPAVCSPSSVARFYRHVLELTYIPDAELVIVNPKNCQTAEEKPYPQEFYMFLFGVGALLSIVVASTLYSYNNKTEEKSKIGDIAKAFCVVNNWNDLFKVNKNEIRIVNGIRYISAIIVIICHYGMFCVYQPSLTINSIKVDELLHTKAALAVQHVDLIVDTFFAISGLFLAKVLLSGNQKNLLIFLVKRYFRLIGPYIVTTFYIMHVAPHTGSGPIWRIANAQETDYCEKYWWKNLFMMHYDIKTMCFGIAWYVPCEYHLAILGVVLFWMYRRNRKGGIIAFLAVAVVLTVQLAARAYSKRINITPFKDYNVKSDMRTLDVMNDAYIRWHDRAGSYFVGIAFGWVMVNYKPAEYRNFFTQTTSTIIAILSLLVMTNSSTIGFWLSEPGRVEGAIAVATNRAFWAVGVCGLIVASEYGSLPAIDNFLGSAFFVPLSKLSYGIYMVHYLILQRSIHVTRTPIAYDLYTCIICVLGTAVIATGVSLVLYLLVEAPCINVSNLYLSERNAVASSTKPVNGVRENGKTKSN